MLKSLLINDEEFWDQDHFKILYESQFFYGIRIKSQKSNFDLTE